MSPRSGRAIFYVCRPAVICRRSTSYVAQPQKHAIPSLTTPPRYKEDLIVERRLETKYKED